MRKIWMPSIIVAITLAARIAAAQSPPPPAPGGPYESLSPGNQKIANAIFDAQQPVGPAGSTKSLDEIAAMKKGGTTGGGKGWGVVWKDLRSEGRVQGNLGQAVSQSNHASKNSSSAGTEITTASGRTMTVGGHDRPNAGVSGRRGFGSDDSSSTSQASGAATHGRDGGGGATTTATTAARGGGGSHGGGHGK